MSIREEENMRFFPSILSRKSWPTFYPSVESTVCVSVLSFLPVCLCFFVLFLSPFPSLAISTKPSSLSLVLSLCLNTLQSTHLGGCYWSSCILLPGNPFPLSQSVAVIAEGIRGGGGGYGGGGGWRGRE